MDHLEAAAQLGATVDAIAALVGDMSLEQARWRPDPASWSALEVINHLDDEEHEDFRRRVDLTLYYPDAPVPPIDPQGWVSERSYNTRDVRESVSRFIASRRESIVWLQTLRDPDWMRACNHPNLGEMRAGDFLVAWVAHDLLHIRQLNELRYAYLATRATPYTVAYAGDW
jgi:hypothetical protein